MAFSYLARSLAALDTCHLPKSKPHAAARTSSRTWGNGVGQSVVCVGMTTTPDEVPAAFTCRVALTLGQGEGPRPGGSRRAPRPDLVASIAIALGAAFVDGYVYS